MVICSYFLATYLFIQITTFISQKKAQPECCAVKTHFIIWHTCQPPLKHNLNNYTKKIGKCHLFFYIIGSTCLMTSSSGLLPGTLQLITYFCKYFKSSVLSLFKDYSLQSSLTSNIIYYFFDRWKHLSICACQKFRNTIKIILLLCYDLKDRNRMILISVYLNDIDLPGGMLL